MIFDDTSKISRHYAMCMAIACMAFVCTALIHRCLPNCTTNEANDGTSTTYIFNLNIVYNCYSTFIKFLTEHLLTQFSVLTSFS